MKEQAFLGKGWCFPPEFRKGVAPTVMVAEEEDIRQSLKILLQTAPGERVHRYDFGCGIRQFMHEEMNLTTQTQLQDVIRRAVLFFESRITLEEVNFDLENLGEGILLIELDYIIRKTNTRSNMVFPFYFREGTELTSF